MSILSAARYGVETAPGGLAIVQELLNTAASGREKTPDLLADVGQANEWLIELMRESVELEAPQAVESVSESDLKELRQLRDSFADSVSGERATPVTSPVTFGLDAAGKIGPLLKDRAVDWLISTVMTEGFLAQHSGDWARLKICGNPACRVSFFDRSKNRSGVWHDVRVCGNAINLRASRSRRRSETPNSETPER
jgi:CGNR zinc finger/Putative stress-induced transcription regulator